MLLARPSAALQPPAPGEPGSYRRREPEKTLLHQVVREHWKTLLAEVAARTDGGSFPGHVTAEFERYLSCGILAHGFARVRCTEVFKFHRRRARKAGAADARPGAITFVQRFGSELNLNVHLHSVIPDGVFVRDRDDGEVSFVTLDPPTDEELARIVQRIAGRVCKLLRPIREANQQDARPPDPLAAAQTDSATSPGRRRRAPPVPKRHEAYFEGFSLHAGAHVHANDREGLAHLCGYGARPPLSQDRLSALPDGNLELRLKRPRDDGSQAVTLPPLDLLRRLAAIVPPPRAHLVRFHGLC